MQKQSKRMITWAAALLLGGSGAFAVDHERNTVGGDFDTGSEWTPAGPPGGGDHAEFGSNGSGTVDFNGAEGTDTFDVNSNTYTWDLNGNTYTLGGTTDRNRVDLGGHLTVTSSSAGGTVQNNVVAGGSDPALNVGRNTVGTLILDGTNVTWNNTADNVYVGDQGPGSVGVIEVRNGATFDVASGNTTVLGRGVDAIGTARVDGSNSLFDAVNSTIGSTGHGTLEISNGGRYNANGPTTIAGTATGTVSVSGANSLYAMNNNNLEMGNDAAAVANITVTSGGSFGNNSVGGGGINRIEVGRVAGSTVTISVDGATSKMYANQLYVGGSSGSAGGNASVTVSDSAILRVHTILRVYGTSTLTLDGGTVQYGTPGGVTLDLRGTLAGNGDINNIGGGADTLSVTGGTLDPGTDSAAGTIAFLEYNFNNDASTTYEIDIFGDGGTSWDQLDFSNLAGTITINGGTVNVTTEALSLDNKVDGFDLIYGDTVTINTLPTLTLPAGYAGNLQFANSGGLLDPGDESLRLVITRAPHPGTIFTVQ